MDDFTMSGSQCLYASEGASAGLPTASSPFTIDLWIKAHTETMAYGGGLVSWGDFSTNRGTNALRLTSLWNVEAYWWGDSATTRISGSIPQGNFADGYWHHIATIFDGATWQLIIDETLVVNLEAASGPTAMSSVQNFCVGRAKDHDGDEIFYRGTIKGLRIWDRAQNVLQHVTSPAPPSPKPGVRPGK